MADTEDRRVTFKTLFELAATLLGGVAMILWLVTSDRIGKVEAKTDKVQDTLQAQINLKADQSDVGEIKTDLRDIRIMMESHIADSGSGKIIPRRNK